MVNPISPRDLLIELEFKVGDIFSSKELEKRLAIWCNLKGYSDTCVCQYMNFLLDYQDKLLESWFRFKGEKNDTTSLIKMWANGKPLRELGVHPIKFQVHLKHFLKRLLMNE